MTTDNPHLAAARKGLALLEARDPGCTDAIDLDRLDVADSMLCPVGQSVGDGDFADGLEKLGVLDHRDHPNMAVEHGFYLDSAEVQELLRHAAYDEAAALYAPLTEAWRQVLTEHRATEEISA